MVRLHILAAALLAFLALASGCRETLNVGTVAVPTWDNVSAFTVSVSVPGNARGGAQGNFDLTITGGTGPFEVTYAFDAGVTPRTTTRNITGRDDRLTVTFDEVTSDTPVTLTVTVKDANNRTGTRTRTFTLRPGAGPDTAPSIVSATFDAATNSVTVTATDAEGDDITINATAPAGMSVDAASKPLGGTGTVTFTFTADDPAAGATGDASFTATANGLSSAATNVTVTIAPFALADDTLYAIPSAATVAAGTPVRITVFTGDPANPFLYMAGVRVIVAEASGFTYVDNSFNVGTPGGAAGDIDGIWALLPVTPDSILLPPDNFIQETTTQGQIAIDFNVTPTYAGATDASYNLDSGSGALFNFEATFDTPGTYQLGFMQSDLVDNTYYQDNNLSPNYFWGDLTNVHPGFTTAITVQ
jgi:hypothetical protein